MFRLASSRFYSSRATRLSELLSKYESTTPKPLNLAQLLSFGRPVSQDSVLASVSYCLYELPRRLATRVRSLESLPFIVGTNPYISKTAKAFEESFYRLADHPPVRNLQENDEFAQVLRDIVKRHANDIPTMAKGFQESARYIPSEEINAFLDGAIRNRISVRLIAEQHIALTDALRALLEDINYGTGNGIAGERRDVGVVDTRCSPRQMIEMCASFVSELCNATLGNAPQVVLDGDVEATFAYIPVHLEYVLTELLKNSFRATVEHHDPRGLGLEVPPIRVTLSSPPSRSHLIVPPPNHSSSSGAQSLTEAALANPNYFSIRIRDQGGGVKRQDMDRIFSYAFTTVNQERLRAQEEGEEDEPFLGVVTGRNLRTGLGTIAGLGYGLPMSRLYARYFGGSLELKSLEGWGSDVFIKLRCLDEAGDSNI